MTELKIIAALLQDISNVHGLVFNTRARRLTLQKVEQRVRREGQSFLTKTMPRLAKAFDKALAAETPLNSTKLGFKPLPGSELPMFMGEFFQQVLQKDGTVLSEPCIKCIRVLRQVLYLFYKYELPYSDEQEQHVVSKFVRTEYDIRTTNERLAALQRELQHDATVLASNPEGCSKDGGSRSPASPRSRDDRGGFTTYGDFLDRAWRRFDAGDYSPTVTVDYTHRVSGQFSDDSGVIDSEVQEGVRLPCSPGITHVSPVSSIAQPDCKSGDRVVRGDHGTDRLLLCSQNEGRADRSLCDVLRTARESLTRLFAGFDPLDIQPRHGPGAVATKQKLWAKYQWTNVSSRITDVYPFDAYFRASMGHVCDTYRDFGRLGDRDLPARVILVPKDSRGPRLISCEPVDFQWIQQGLGRAIVQLVEGHVLTKHNVRFTDQTPNQIGALWGSKTGRYATLDLNEASDRVSADLVRLLFPEKVCTYLMACRSSSTRLPSGEELTLQKFAPMGSCLCFPILALTVWSILDAGATDAYTRERILVYGDDVVVPTAYAARAIELLESFGLKVNRDKSCTKGFFRESCGTDAFKGENVTPVRLRTVWSSSRCPHVYSSWISYANSFYDRQYLNTYKTIVGLLTRIYGSIPGEVHVEKRAPSLREVPDVPEYKVSKRWNSDFQKYEYKVWVLYSPAIKHKIRGWDMLLRFFAETANAKNENELSRQKRWTSRGVTPPAETSSEVYRPFSVSTYTSRSTSMLVLRWR